MRYLILTLLLLVVGPASAQTTSDQIYKLDKSVIRAVVDEIGDTDIIYFLPDDTAKRKSQRIPRSQVWKIVYENGESEVINSEVINTPAPAAEIVKKEAEDVPGHSEKPTPFSKLSVTVGFDGNYLLGSEAWTHQESGVGLMTLMGGSARGNYQITKSVSAFLTLGFSQASVVKNYFSGEELLYKNELTLSGPGAGIGLKYFFKESLYVVAQGKGNFLKTKSRSSEDGTESESQATAMCPSFGLGVGYTRKISQVLVEAEVHFQMMQSGFGGITTPLNMVGARLGIGFAGFGKKKAASGR